MNHLTNPKYNYQFVCLFIISFLLIQMDIFEKSYNISKHQDYKYHYKMFLCLQKIRELFHLYHSLFVKEKINLYFDVNCFNLHLIFNIQNQLFLII